MKLLIADDHTLFRDTLVEYIKRADSGAEVALAKDFYGVMEILQDDPDQDLVMLDLRMPGMNGLEGFKEVHSAYPKVRTVLMSGLAEPAHVEEAMENGAVGYFPKTLSGKALMQAIELVLSGERFVPLDRSSNQIMPSFQDDGLGRAAGITNHQPISAAQVDFKLTPRENEVLSYLAKGASNKEIANALGLQVVTVKLHVRGVCKKLDVKNRTQAALKAQELGLVS